MLAFGPLKKTLNAFTGCLTFVVAAVGVLMAPWMSGWKAVEYAIPVLVWLACQPFIKADDDPPSAP